MNIAKKHQSINNNIVNNIVGRSNVLINKKDCLIILLVGLFCVTIGFNKSLDTIMFLFISLILFILVKKEEFYYLFPFLMFFEPQLVLPFGIGSIMRVYIVLLVLKILFNRNQFIEIKSSYLFFSIPLILLETHKIIQGHFDFSIITNTIVLMIIHTKTSKNPKMLKKELFYLGCAAFFSGLYGLLHQSYIYTGIQVKGDYLNFARMSGSIADPNYSALIFNIGIFALFNVPFYKWIKSFLIIALYIFLFMTVSVQGIIGNIIFLISFLIIFQYKKDKRNSKLAPFLLLLVMIFLMLFSNNPILDPYKARIYYITQNTGDYSSITSNRSDLSKIYIELFNNKPISEKIFGGDLITSDNDTRLRYIALIGQVTHNSYIDMLFEVGIFGTVIIIIMFIWGIIFNYKLYKKTRDEIYSSIVILKVLILYFCLGISIFPFRYFLYLYLL